MILTPSAETEWGSAGGARQRFVDTAHGLPDDLRERGRHLLLRAELEYLFLRLGEAVAVPRQCAGLTFNHLAHHRGYVHGASLGGVEAVLLRCHVVHGGSRPQPASD